jgi:hypothetical protein
MHEKQISAIDQVRAQREYLDSVDTVREADNKIASLEGELERWRRIKQDAEALGAVSLSQLVGDEVQGNE